MRALKIISGGQTGIDRAALDVALKHGVDCGGWCPAGRRDEFGKIPSHYPLQELPGGDFTERTLENVKGSDGTLIIYSGQPRGGTEQTVRFCVELQRPYHLIDALKTSVEDGENMIGEFVRKNEITVLNVAGPRESEWPEGYEYATRLLEAFVTRRSIS